MLRMGESGVAGRFEVIIQDRDTGEITQKLDYQDNLILNSGLNYLGTQWFSLMYLHIGSGNSVPVATQTLLDSHQAVVIRNGAANQNPPDSVSAPYVNLETPFYSSSTFSYTFDLKRNVNISELGLSPSGEVSAPLFSRALIKDVNGTPTTITIKDNEIATVNYEVRQYYDSSIYEYQISVNVRGVPTLFNVKRMLYDMTNTYAWTDSSIYPDQNYIKVGGRSKTIGSSSYPLSFQSSPSPVVDHISPRVDGSGASSTKGDSIVEGVYIANSYQRSDTLTFGLGGANYPNGIKSIIVNTSRGDNVFVFSSVDDPSKGLPKTQYDKLDMEISYSWGRYVAP